MPDLQTIRAALTAFASAPTTSPAFAAALGFLPTDHPSNVLTQTNPFSEAVQPISSEVFRLGGMETGQGSAGFYLVRLNDWGLRSSDRDRARRRVARVFVQQATVDHRWLIALVPRAWPAGAERDVEFVLPRIREKGEVSIVRALVDSADPNDFHLRLLADAALSPDLTLAAISRRWSDAFSVERVTKDFYQDFQKLRDRFVAMLQEHNRDNPLLADPARLTDVSHFATRQLGRILFVWFLQAKRWLEDDSQYLPHLFENNCRGKSTSFFSDILLPLFFEALARAKSSRPPGVNAILGAVPYLNGGLFQPTSFEDELFGQRRERIREIVVPNELFDPRLRDSATGSVLGFLSSYRFNTRESTPDDMSVDPDPELLGKVFENLNQVQERHDTGAYYTPREIVRFMCREAIDGYLADEAKVERSLLDRLRSVAGGTDEETSPGQRLDAATRVQLDNALDRIRICDPAVGSGAFLVGSLREMSLLRRGVYEIATGYAPDPDLVAEWKRDVVIHNLYEVDLNPYAVDICQLRLWLSLVLDKMQPDDEPLPNLNFRILAGDSLVDRIGDIAFEDSLTLGAQQGRFDGILIGLHAQIEEATQLFQQAKRPDVARRLRENVKKLKQKAILH